jgi:hypothetical protein
MTNGFIPDSPGIIKSGWQAGENQAFHPRKAGFAGSRRRIRDPENHLSESLAWFKVGTLI